jgi:tetratricopeptide (TPR) repeat protein
MAKKKRKRDGRPPKRRNRSSPPPSDLPFVDPRALEGSTYELVRELRGKTGAETPLDRAQEIMYRAFREDDDERRVQLAREALSISADCADAYLELAEHTSNRKEALELYEKALAAGERALGPEAFQRDVGRFWGIIETRPYMRARLELSIGLWSAGRRDEAVQHLQEMLRLNPNDNQGVRYTLAGFLLFLDRDEELARLLHQYDDAGAGWAYTRALLAFRQSGDTVESRQLLKAARKANKHVPDYLLGRKFPPDQPLGAYSYGDESEALNYIRSFMVGWKATPGAVAWLRANVAAAKKKPEAHPKGPLGFIKKWLKDKLPQQLDVWQADFRIMPMWIMGDQPSRPWVVMITSVSDDLVLAQKVLEGAPSGPQLWDELVQAMQYPKVGEPHRPTEVQVPRNDQWEGLRSHLEEIGITVTPAEELDHLDEAFDSMCEHVCGKPRPGLLDAPGATPEQVGSAYEAAALYFQQAPWKKVGDMTAIKVECSKFHSGPWYAVVMGQSGLTTGLAFYDDLRLLRKMWACEIDDEESARQTVGGSVIYGEEWELPLADLEAAQRYGWKVARPDAYPSIFHKDRGRTMRPPLVWELEMMEGCLRAVPEFVNCRRPDDHTAETLTVPVASGPLTLVMSWVEGQDG